MKKYHFIALAVCCGFLWACQKDGPTENPFADAPWAIDETLPVPIMMSAPASGGIQTKSDAITSLDGKRLKVVGYDQNGTQLLGKELSAVGNGSGVGSSGTIQFKTDNYAQDATYYYPYTGSSSNFVFYAYHAANFATVTSPSALVRSITWNPASRDTNEDILVAAARASNYELAVPILNDDSSVRYAAGSYSGFNARYQRVTRLVSAEVMQDHYPVLNFSHALARIIINAKAFDQAAQDSFDPDAVPAGSGLKVQLKTITQANARAKVVVDLAAVLDITDYRAPEADEIVLTWDASSAALTAPLAFSNTSAPATMPVVGGTPLHADNSLFIVPGNDAVTITYTITNNTSGEVDPVSATLALPTGGYLPGCTYTYNIVVDSEEVVVIKTNLAGWSDYLGEYSGSTNIDQD